MSYRKVFVFLVLWISLCLYFFYMIYGNAKSNAIEELNHRQLIHGKQAARSIEAYFEHWVSFLKTTAEKDTIVMMNDDGKAFMEFALKVHQGEIRGITRVNADGRIVYTLPYVSKAIGADISGQKHVRNILKTRMTMVSDVFRTVQGDDAVAIHVPVFKGKDFVGTIAVLLDFQVISKRFLEDIRLGETGYAWMISADGIELYCPVPGHTGNSVFENCKDFPTIISMAKEMIQGRQGVCTYSFDRIRDQQVETIQKHAVYMPIKVGSSFWSIVVASSEAEVLASLESFKNRLILLFGVLLFGAVFFSYFGMKAWGVVKEERNRLTAEKALSKSKEKYQTLFMNAPVGIFQFTPEGLYKMVNPAFASMLGFDSPEDMIIEVKNIADLYIEPDQREAFKSLLSQHGELSGYEMHLRRKDGAMVWMSVFAKCVVDESTDAVYYDGFALDITKRKKAEQAYAKSEERYREIIENAVTGIYQVTEEGRFIMANQKMAEIFAYDSPQYILESINISDLYAYPEERPNLLKEIKEKGVINGKVVEFKRKDGQRFWGKFNTRITTGKDGANILEGLLEDITNLKMMEAQLRQSRKMESIGTLAGGIAHEFNNILGIILGNTELALTDVPDWNPARGFLKEVIQASLRAKDIVKQLLSFSRKSEEKQTPIDIIPIIKESLGLLRSSLPAFIEFRQNVYDDRCVIFGDATQIHQVMINLCANAAAAMRENGGILEVNVENIDPGSDEALSDTDLPADNYAKITVRDTGCGIAPEHIESIFDPYFTTKAVGQGTGMGLSVVHGIVTGHDGLIRVKSEPGKGTVVSIFFPVTDAETENDRPTVSEVPGGDEKILFVDDESSLAVMGRHLLERLGYHVDTCLNPIEALETFRADPNRFDIIITDMTMPHMTGDKLIQEILALRPDMPTIICTGFSERIDEETALKMGVSGFIMKPVDIRELAAKVREVLDKQK
jgi:two-component system, cell cycle sensor histidine kinase and response regulator CckA